jgi:citrate lyase beta subunit
MTANSVAVVDGKMVDEPIVRLARAVLADVADRD